MSSLAAQIGQLSPEKIRQLAKALQDRKPRSSGPSLKRHEGRTEYPLSFGQERLWFLEQLVPGTAAYNWPFAVRFGFSLDPGIFRRTMQEVARRHEILRTVYPAVGSGAIQRVLPPGDVPLQVIDLSHLPESSAVEEAVRVVREDSRVPFHLSEGPLYRYQLFQLGPESSIFAGTMHHSLVDAWSRKVFMEEMGAIWTAFSLNREAQLPPVPVQYGDFAVWQRESLQGPVGEQLLSYWKKQLKDVPRLEFPRDHPRPAVMSYRGETEIVSVPQKLTEDLRAIGRKESATLFMTLLAAFQTLLMRYTGQTDIAGAAPVGNRDRVELERLIGFFVNTLVLRVDLSGNPTFRELLGRVRKVCVDGYAHQQMPFERLVDELQLKRDLGRSPLAQFIFQLEDIPRSSANKGDASRQAWAKPLDVDAGTAIFDFHIHLYEAWDTGMMERPEGIRGTFTYNSDLFEAGTIRRLLAHFGTLLESIAANPDCRICELPILSESERCQLTAWNQTLEEFGGAQTVAGRFEAVASRTPEAVAIVDGGRRLTYAELNARANQVAHYLRRQGVGPDVLVALCMDRSIEMLTALLGVLKAGGAYVPIDPDYPAERRRLMLANAQPLMVLTDLESAREEIARQSTTNPEPSAKPENLVYVIYTSGSTGVPKGVAVEHRQLVNYTDAVSHRIGFGVQNLNFALVTTLATDLGNTSVFPALCHGGTLHIISREMATNALELGRYFEQNQIDCLKITPSHMAELMAGDGLSNLIPARTLVLGGEALPRDWAESLSQQKAGTAVFNHYGPTECTVGALACEVVPALPSTHGGTVPIGKPLPNGTAYILDARLEQAPVGTIGELYLGGAGVARGYLNRPDATAGRFLPDPFATRPGSRMYRTGDRARRLADGSVEFLGRADDQVKIRGYRVELGDIQASLTRHPGVEDAAVIVREERGTGQLVACVVPRLKSFDSADTERVSEWQSIYEQLYRQPAAALDDAVSTVGWNSSYSGLPIPDDEMRESVDCTVKRILALRPQRMLEIGCGTGLLAFRIAPHVQSYCATDFSSSAIRYAEEQKSFRSLSQLELFHRTANDFSGFSPASFDVVVMNSVVQYFPDVHYLLRVLEGAAALLRPGGFLFIGDVRSLPLLETFHASVEIHRASVSTPLEKLRRRIQRRLAKEEECVIDPEFFRALRQRVPAITSTDVHLKLGRYHNELSKFRYDVVLQTGGQPKPRFESMEWSASIPQLLERDHPECLAVRGIPNARVWSDRKAATLLHESNRDVSVAELKRVLESRDPGCVDPEPFRALGERLGYTVNLTWSSDPACFDAFLLKRTSSSAGHLIAPEDDSPKARPWYSYTNNPLNGVVSRELVRQLRQDLAAQLPAHMIPSGFSVLDRLPLTPSGKVDRRALQEVETELVQSESFVAPRDSFELRLAQIWEEALGIDRIGVKDSFFELGGHSLLAVRVIARIQKTFGQSLPLAALFEKPAIEQLAPLLRRGFEATDFSPLVALRDTGSDTPLFLVHPAGGGVLCYYELARHLGADRPLYGLQFQGFEDQSEGFVSVQKMATEYLRCIRKVQPRGPYLLGGWSAGGVVAFEMARQLRAEGQAVPLVLVLDMRAPVEGSRNGTSAPSQVDTLVSLAKKLEMYTGRQFQIAGEELGSLDPERQLDFFVERMKARNMVPEEVDATWLREFLAVYDNNVSAVQAYRPDAYDGPVVLFRGDDSLPEIERQYPAIYSDPTLGWQSLCSQEVAVHRVPGNHLSMIAMPNVPALASTISKCLEHH